MRLTQHEVKSIKDTFYDIFETGNVYIFGSRVDNAKRGGDIDLFLDPKCEITVSQKLHKKIKFLGQLQSKIGDQKIDVVISCDKNRPIEQEAITNGVLL